jgi:hypothetical protein
MAFEEGDKVTDICLVLWSCTSVTFFKDLGPKFRIEANKVFRSSGFASDISEVPYVIIK